MTSQILALVGITSAIIAVSLRLGAVIVVLTRIAKALEDK